MCSLFPLLQVLQRRERAGRGGGNLLENGSAGCRGSLAPWPQLLLRVGVVSLVAVMLESVYERKWVEPLNVRKPFFLALFRPGKCILHDTHPLLQGT